ncbi:MAG: 30S ribosomal protein S26e [Thermoproteota archaeon]|jgi:SSU ribosomal protein S26E
MTKKRKSRGRAKGAKGRDSILSCDACGRLIPRGKAIKVTREQSIVDPQLAAELEKKGARIMKVPVTVVYCVSCAIFRGIRKVRSEEERKSQYRW